MINKSAEPTQVSHFLTISLYKSSWQTTKRLNGVPICISNNNLLIYSLFNLLSTRSLVYNSEYILVQTIVMPPLRTLEYIAKSFLIGPQSSHPWIYCPPKAVSASSDCPSKTRFIHKTISIRNTNCVMNMHSKTGFKG
jgi:hypothetical protein